MEPDVRWQAAINLRSSRRSYQSKPIPAGVMEQLQTVATDIGRQVEGFRIGIAPTEADVFRGIVGSYGKVEGAPSFVAFIGQTHREHMPETTGYYGEGLILEATRLGIQTCWVGGLFHRSQIHQLLHVKEEETVYAITPIGYALDKHSGNEKLLKFLARSNRRKELDAICPGCSVDQLPPWVIDGLQAVRLAPSAMNRQPWSFQYADQTVTISTGRRDRLARMDCGIALLHFQLGALAAGTRGTWEFLNHPGVARFNAVQDEDRTGR